MKKAYVTPEMDVVVFGDQYGLVIATSGPTGGGNTGGGNGEDGQRGLQFPVDSFVSSGGQTDAAAEPAGFGGGEPVIEDPMQMAQQAAPADPGVSSDVGAFEQSVPDLNGTPAESVPGLGDAVAAPEPMLSAPAPAPDPVLDGAPMGAAPAAEPAAPAAPAIDAAPAIEAAPGFGDVGFGAPAGE